MTTPGQVANGASVALVVVRDGADQVIRMLARTLGEAVGTLGEPGGDPTPVLGGLAG